MKMAAVVVPPVRASPIHRSFISNKLRFSSLSIILFWLYEELVMRYVSYFQLCVCIMSISEVIFYWRMKILHTATLIFHFHGSEMHSGSAFHCVNKCGSNQAPLTAGCHLPSPYSLTALVQMLQFRSDADWAPAAQWGIRKLAWPTK